MADPLFFNFIHVDVEDGVQAAVMEGLQGEHLMELVTVQDSQPQRTVLSGTAA